MQDYRDGSCCARRCWSDEIDSATQSASLRNMTVLADSSSHYDDQMTAEIAGAIAAF